MDYQILDYAVYVAFADHEYDVITIHNAFSPIEAAQLAADVLTAEYCFGWRIMDIYPIRGGAHAQ